jgi:hypothetical protein
MSFDPSGWDGSDGSWVRGAYDELWGRRVLITREHSLDKGKRGLIVSPPYVWPGRYGPHWCIVTDGTYPDSTREQILATARHQRMYGAHYPRGTFILLGPDDKPQEAPPLPRLPRRGVFRPVRPGGTHRRLQLPTQQGR